MHLLPFLLRAQAVLRRHNSAFLAGKSHPMLLRSWPGSTGSSFRHYPPPLHPYLPLFVTIHHYSRLFATIRTIRYLGLFAVHYSRLFAIRYSLFGFSRHPFLDNVKQLDNTFTVHVGSSHDIIILIPNTWHVLICFLSLSGGMHRGLLVRVFLWYIHFWAPV